MTRLPRFDIGTPRFRPGSWQAYAVAGAIVLVATILRLALQPLIPIAFFLTYFPAAIAVTFLCGSAAGFLSISLAVGAAWLLVPPGDADFMLIYRSGIFAIGAGTVTAVVGGMRAATADVRRLNATLTANEGKFRGLLESAPDAIVIVDDALRIVLINAQAEAMFDYRRAELIGQPVMMLMPEDGREPYAARLNAIIAGATPIVSTSEPIELYGLRASGRQFPIEASVALLKTESGLLVSSAIRDITARRQIEASLAEAGKAKSDFLATVSHELRTPLNAIIGFSEMIRDSDPEIVDARTRDYANDINEAGRHLQELINDILDISKVEAGKLELREEPVEVAETIEACRRVVVVMAQGAGVSLTVDIPRPLPLIPADPLRFKQVLLNLMSNAVKFTPAGGNVTVSAWFDGGGMTIAVKDTGIGMTPEDVAVALQPFRQIDGALNRRFDGTGLGLPLAKALVELHGGRLEIESAPDMGTTVLVRLPADRIMTVAA